MKKIAITTLFLIGFVGMALFGFTVMLHAGAGGSMDNCITSKINTSAECPASGLAMAFFHIEAYQSFSITPITHPIIIFLLSFILLLIIGMASVKLFGPSLSFLFSRSRLFYHKFFSSQPQNITHWLSLFENSPSFS